MTTMTTKLQAFHVAMLTDKSEDMLLSGQRLCVVRWKTTKELAEAGRQNMRPAVCVSLPMIEIAVMPECLAEALTSALQDMQDVVMRRWIDSQILATPGLNLASLVLPSDLVTADGIANFHREDAISKRLSKAGIAAWFDRVLAEPLGIAFVERNSQIDDVVLEKAILQHREILCKLASPRDRLPEKIALQLQRALELLPAQDSVSLTLNARLEGFIKVTDMELGVSL